ASLTFCARATASVAMFTPPWALLALAYHLASRLAYVLYIGLALGRQERTGYLTLRHGAEGGFRRFRRLGATLMYNDAGSFVLLGLAAAVFDHAAILAFYRLVEKPHFEKYASGGRRETEQEGAGER